MAQLGPTSVLTATSGMKMPVIGLGTWQSKSCDVAAAVDVALETGYRLIDTAYLYNNEAAIGGVLSKWFSSGKLKREEVFITTKLPLTANNPKYVKEHLEKQVKALQVDYVDLYLIHNPVGLLPGEVVRRSDGSIDPSCIKLDMATDLEALWKEMERQVDSGLTKAIGVSNFNIGQIERMLKVARIPPSNLQIELYLYNQGKAEQEFCKSKGITLTSYGTLGSPGAPKSFFSGATDNPMEDPLVVRIAKAHGKTPGQVLLRHLIQLGIAVIPKSTNPERIRQNIQVFDFELSDAEINELNCLDKGEKGRRFVIDNFKMHPECPYPYPRTK